MSDNEISETQEDHLAALVETGFFSCTKCKELFIGVIVQIEDVGNVCKTCYKSTYMTNDYKLLHLFTSLTELIMSKLKIPCKNRVKGCTWMSLNNAKNDHEDTCMYKERECPFRIVVTEDESMACDWKDSLNMLENHIVETHQEIVLKSLVNNNRLRFFLDVDVNKINRNGDFRMLMVDSENYLLLKISLDPSTNCLKHALYKTCLNEQPIIYTMKYQDSQEINQINRSFQLDAKVKPFHCLYIKPENMETINLHILQQIMCDIQQVKLVLELDFYPTKESSEHSNNIKSEENSAAQIEGCECPVCYEPFRPPIYLCTGGHSICEKCKTELKNCPKCKLKITSSRNFDLEGLLSKNIFSCKYKEKGCTQSSNLSKLTVHEARCRFRVFACSVANCDSEGTATEITAHLIADHSEHVSKNVLKYIYEFKNVPPKERLFEHYLIDLIGVFQLTAFQVDNVVYFGVRKLYCSRARQCARFKYRITITFEEFPNWKLIATHRCMAQRLLSAASRDFLKISLMHFNEKPFTVEFEIYED